jgi:type I restriction enzyme S subunit
MEEQKVPQLRFPEFSMNWKRKKLGNIAELTSSKRVYLSDYVEEGIPFYRGKEISELKRGITPDDILYITEDSYNNFKEKYGVPRKGDLLITAVGTLANVLRITSNNKFYFKDGNLIWFKNIEENSHFLEFVLSYYEREIKKTAIGSSQKALTMVELRKIYLLIPSRDEQQKIASFLSAVDKKIEQLTRKKALLEEYKKGVMQKLFPRPGEQHPELRFKDENGKDFPDWEVKRLGEVGKFSKGKGISKKDIDVGGKYPCIRYGELYTEYKELIDEVVSNTNLDTKKLTLSQRNDVLIPSSGETHIDIATASCILKDDVILGGDINILRSKVNGIFLSYLLNNAYKFRIANLAQGNSVVHLYSSQLKSLEVSLPTNNEQKRIVNFLTNIDEKINSIEESIQKTQTFKKGLLQQMFV